MSTDPTNIADVLMEINRNTARANQRLAEETVAAHRSLLDATDQGVDDVSSLLHQQLELSAAMATAPFVQASAFLPTETDPFEPVTRGIRQQTTVVDEVQSDAFATSREQLEELRRLYDMSTDAYLDTLKVCTDAWFPIADA